MALCTVDDVAVRLGGVSFATSDVSAVVDLIAAAQGHIERVAARSIEDATRTETFDAPESPAIWLTHTPVNSITSITVDGTTLTTDQYKWHSAGRIIRVSNGLPRPWATRKIQTVVVVYSGGYVTIPEDLKDICARVAARAFQAGEAYESAPDGAGGIRQVSLAGSDSVTFASTVSDVTSALSLTDDEMKAVRYYRNDVIA